MSNAARARERFESGCRPASAVLCREGPREHNRPGRRAGVLYFQGVVMTAWSGLGPVPRRVFKTREPTLPVGWKVRLLRRSVVRRATIE
jgi:hypothetical protein